MTRRHGLALVPLLAATLLAGCGVQPKAEYPDPDRERLYRDGSILGEEGFQILGPRRRGQEEQGGAGLGVNSFLWRASLDTLSFMPVASADPFGGVILTDWYSPPESPNERFKVNVYILDRQLRADGVRVGVFRQERAPGGEWRDAQVGTETGRQLEDTILTRARQLSIATRPQQG